MARRRPSQEPQSPAAPPRVPPVHVPPSYASPVRRLTIAALLIAGLALAATWYAGFIVGLLTLGPWGPVALIAFVATVVAAVAFRPTVAAVSSVGTTVARHRRLATGVITLATFAYLFATAREQGRPLRPYVHDEFSYLIQAHQFAQLHGWMSAHPLAPFFDSFQLLDAPVYASAYFPGTALLHVPGVWLGLPPWVTSLAVAAVVAGLLFRVAVELLDGPLAIAAVLLLWSDGRYRTLSVMTLAQMPLLMWGLAATAAWLKWRPAPRGVLAAAVGACLGMAAVTRPVDALCFAIPIGVDVLLTLRRATVPRRAVTVMLILAAAVPCLLLQLSLNHGITGRWTRTPFRLYADRDYPGTAYGFGTFDPAARPRSPLPQKQALYDEYRPVIADHTPASAVDNLFRGHATGLSPPRIELTLVRLPYLPLPMLLPLIPVALAGLTRARGVVLAAVPLFLLLYVGYVFFFPHYTLAVAGAVVLAVVIGADQLPLLLPAAVRPRAAAAVPLLLMGLAVAGLPQFDPAPDDDLFAAPVIADVDRQLAALGPGRAVVLFTYDPKRNTNEEPVFNADVAWPDDAPIVRAHDLGPPRNRDLFAYYAARQPDRFAYRYDEATRTLTPLGPVTALATPDR